MEEAVCSCSCLDEEDVLDCCSFQGELDAPRREGELCSGEEEADVPLESRPPPPSGEPATLSGDEALVSDKLLLVDDDARFDEDSSLHLTLLVPASRRLSGLVWDFFRDCSFSSSKGRTSEL